MSAKGLFGIIAIILLALAAVLLANVLPFVSLAQIQGATIASVAIILICIVVAWAIKSRSAAKQ